VRVVEWAPAHHEVRDAGDVSSPERAVVRLAGVRAASGRGTDEAGREIWGVLSPARARFRRDAGDTASPETAVVRDPRDALDAASPEPVRALDAGGEVEAAMCSQPLDERVYRTNEVLRGVSCGVRIILLSCWNI
jgi:hypothetical protein